MFAVKGYIMNVTKIISAILALMAAVLIAMAGKSCAKDAAEKNAARRSRNTTEAPSYHLITDPPYENDDGDLPHLVEDDTDEAVTEREYVTVTNIFGDVVETIPVTTPEEALIPTTTLSILDAYNQEHSVEEYVPPTVEYGTVDEHITIEIY